MEKPDWYYDDLKQVGTDFADAAEVATYDERQSDSAAADDALLDRLGLASAAVMADIGCGTGLLACAGAMRCREVQAIDVSPPMLAATRRRAAARGLANDRATVACHLRDEHSTYGWIMEGLIRQAGLDLLAAEYSNGVYADYLAMRPA